MLSCPIGSLANPGGSHPSLRPIPGTMSRIAPWSVTYQFHPARDSSLVQSAASLWNRMPYEQSSRLQSACFSKAVPESRHSQVRFEPHPDNITMSRRFAATHCTGLPRFSFVLPNLHFAANRCKSIMIITRAQRISCRSAGHDEGALDDAILFGKRAPRLCFSSTSAPPLPCGDLPYISYISSIISNLLRLHVSSRLHDPRLSLRYAQDYDSMRRSKYTGDHSALIALPWRLWALPFRSFYQ